MGEQLGRDGMAQVAKVVDGIGQVGRIPVDDGRNRQVEPGGAELLRVGATISDAPLLEGADDLREETTLLALVEPGMAASAQFRLSSQ